ncbi:MAG: hypothetical protein HRT61_11255 [Ekhidna sp.]|nr:hypothetical protein [Ekhidna sp.]
MKLFMKGFNHGYLLAKEAPKEFKLYRSLGDQETEYGVGFKKGSELGILKRKEKGISRDDDGLTYDF